MKKLIYALFQIHNIHASKILSDDLKLKLTSVVLNWIQKDLIRNVNRYSVDEMKKYVDELNAFKKTLEREQELKQS